jgi:hypothetical protein
MGRLISKGQGEFELDGYTIKRRGEPLVDIGVVWDIFAGDRHIHTAGYKKHAVKWVETRVKGEAAA